MKNNDDMQMNDTGLVLDDDDVHVAPDKQPVSTGNPAPTVAPLRRKKPLDESPISFQKPVEHPLGTDVFADDEPEEDLSYIDEIDDVEELKEIAALDEGIALDDEEEDDLEFVLDESASDIGEFVEPPKPPQAKAEQNEETEFVSDENKPEEPALKREEPVEAKPEKVKPAPKAKKEKAAKSKPKKEAVKKKATKKKDEPVVEAVKVEDIEPVTDAVPPSMNPDLDAPSMNPDLDSEPPSMNPDIEVLDANEGVQESTGKEVKVRQSNELEELAKGRLGEELIKQGVITEAQLHVALQEKKISGKMIGEVLVDLGFIEDEELSIFLAKMSGFGVFDPKAIIMDGEILSYIKKEVAQKYNILPFSVDGDDMSVAMADPYDVVALDMLRQQLPKTFKIKPYVATQKVISDAIDAAYGYASSINAILKELEEEGDDVDLTKLTDEEAYSHPIVRLVNSLIFEAVKIGASDLHFEPEENFVRLRYRLDGVLFTAQILHKQHWSGISQRIKIMSSLNIADKLAPQDGRIQMNVAGHEVDFRVSSLPTVHGENIVMRVLDKQSSIMPLSALGFSEANRARIDKAQARPEGIIIVTGPTGSGKTTTLYSMLNEINTVDVNIQTLEDPVEYSLPMIRQTSIREGVLEFADGIRALLRQDPDIIFVGEVRDKTTAEMALQAAMTGHQVYTSLHTNDSFGALPRLFDLGMVPGMVAGNIISVFAQRLGRVLCPNCKEPHIATDEECVLLGIESGDAPEIFDAHQGGCDHCGGQGYKGRVALAEILLFDDEMDAIVARGGTRAEIKEMAVAKEFKSIKDDGMLKILEGKTSFEAVAKVVSIA